LRTRSPKPQLSPRESAWLFQSQDIHTHPQMFLETCDVF
jgi:hypothetical protein